DPEDARGQVPVDAVAVQREVKDDEGADGKQSHSGHRLQRAQLDQQLLAQQGSDGPSHRRSPPVAGAFTGRAPRSRPPHRYSSAISPTPTRPALSLSVAWPPRSPSTTSASAS